MKNVFFCKEPIEITRKTFDKINELMKVDFNDADMPQMERLINMLDARPETIFASFAWEFEDSTRIIMDIESNYYDYMVSSSWYNSIYDKSGCFETEYQVYPSMRFEIGGNTYICQFEIIGEETQGGATMLKEVKVSKLAKMIDMLDVGQDIEFSSSSGENDGWECWYFAKKMRVQEHASDFLLIDYCGGGQAQAYSIYNNQGAEQLDIEECLRAYMYTINDTSCDHFGQVGGEFVIYMDEEEE